MVTGKADLVVRLSGIGRSQRWLAAKCGVDPKTASRWGRDLPVPAYAWTIIELCEHIQRRAESDLAYLNLRQPGRPQL